jgi:hypothetical protein
VLAAEALRQEKEGLEKEAAEVRATAGRGQGLAESSVCTV